MSVVYRDSVLPRHILIARVARRAASELLSSARDSLLLLVLGWAPLMMPLAALKLGGGAATYVCGALSILSLFGFAYFLRSSLRRSVSTGLVMVFGAGLVSLLCLATLAVPAQRIEFLLGALLGGLLSSAVNFILYTAGRVKREAMLG